MLGTPVRVFIEKETLTVRHISEIYTQAVFTQPFETRLNFTPDQIIEFTKKPNLATIGKKKRFHVKP
jgi:hypothetical protein